MKTIDRQTLMAIAIVSGALFGWQSPSVRWTTLAQAQDKQVSSGQLDRTVLPIPEPKLSPITEVDARTAKAPPRPAA